MAAEETLKSLQEAIFDGEVQDAKAAAQEAVTGAIAPDQILKDAIMPALMDIGESMEEGDFFMPEVKISTKTLLEVAEILRSYVIPVDKKADYAVPPWTGEGDIDDIGSYLKDKIEESRDLTAEQQMGILDMVASGLDTHEFTPCKIQATETND
ncbi:MAG: B12-binding domain-containing protein [Desulfobacterales bacterium]|nr:B12-binding domain-containing protein [Desulfobacterales bacterium]